MSGTQDLQNRNTVDGIKDEHRAQYTAETQEKINTFDLYTLHAYFEKPHRTPQRSLTIQGN